MQFLWLRNLRLVDGKELSNYQRRTRKVLSFREGKSKLSSSASHQRFVVDLLVANPHFDPLQYATSYSHDM